MSDERPQLRGCSSDGLGVVLHHGRYLTQIPSSEFNCQLSKYILPFRCSIGQHLCFRILNEEAEVVKRA